MSDSTTLSHKQSPALDDPQARSAARRLLFMRCVWLVSAPILIALACFFLPLQINVAQSFCTGDNCLDFQPTANTLHELSSIGLSLQALAIIIVAVIVLCALTWFVIAIVIAWKNFSNWFALCVSFLALVQTAMATRPPAVNMYTSSWQWIVMSLLILLNDTMYVIAGTLFPNGKLAPRWTRLILLAWLVIGLPCFVLSELPSPLPLQWQIWLEIVWNYCWYLCIAAIIVAQVYRYRRLYQPIERQQTKWVLFFGSIALIQQIIQFSLQLVFPTFKHTGSLYYMLYYPDTKLFLTLLGFSLLFAMLRYRLWDIDIIINHALVYGLLTALLALVYFGLIVSLQALMSNVTGQTGENPFVLVISTLAIAALFQPLRHGIQNIIDRRFYRRKYDAVQVIELFSTHLRNQGDLTELQQQLLSAVEQTMQPTHLSLWLRPISRERHNGKFD